MAATTTKIKMMIMNSSSSAFINFKHESFCSVLENSTHTYGSYSPGKYNSLSVEFIWHPNDLCLSAVSDQQISLNTPDGVDWTEGAIDMIRTPAERISFDQVVFIPKEGIILKLHTLKEEAFFLWTGISLEKLQSDQSIKKAKSKISSSESWQIFPVQKIRPEDHKAFMTGSVLTLYEPRKVIVMHWPTNSTLLIIDYDYHTIRLTGQNMNAIWTPYFLSFSPKSVTWIEAFEMSEIYTTDDLIYLSGLAVLGSERKKAILILSETDMTYVEETMLQSKRYLTYRAYSVPEHIDGVVKKSKVPGQYMCNICDFTTTCPLDLISHTESQAHRSNVTLLSKHRSKKLKERILICLEYSPLSSAASLSCMLNVPSQEINRCLYALESDGLVKKELFNSQRPYWSCAP
jgi:hypothetical protein